MKKEYVKPYLALESFQLVASIAGACNEGGATPLNHGIDTCTLEDSWLFGEACGEFNFRLLEDKNAVCYQGIVDGGAYLTS